MIYENISVSRSGHLVFAGYDTLELAKTFGTTLFVMISSISRDFSSRRYRFFSAFS